MIKPTWRYRNRNAGLLFPIHIYGGMNTKQEKRGLKKQALCHYFGGQK